MKRKTVKAFKAFKKLSSTEKAVATAAGTAIFPVALTLGVYKEWEKKHGAKKKRRRRKKWMGMF
ncbi:MAG: hypothetical protein IKC31_03125 [Clostridia bacterium]|nr:hypothetical protein [Clostridia bacterium]